MAATAAGGSPATLVAASLATRLRFLCLLFGSASFCVDGPALITGGGMLLGPAATRVLGSLTRADVGSVCYGPAEGMTLGTHIMVDRCQIVCRRSAARRGGGKMQGGDGQRERSWRHASFLERHKLLPALTLMATRSHARRVACTKSTLALHLLQRMRLQMVYYHQDNPRFAIRDTIHRAQTHAFGMVDEATVGIAQYCDFRDVIQSS